MNKLNRSVLLTSLARALVGTFLVFVCFSSQVHAGVFGIPHFVPSGDLSLGLEPEFTLSSGAGVGLNLKVTQGLSDLVNVTGVIGTGSGPRRFRFGGDIAFDFFPDAEGQPGIGLALQGMYYRLKDSSQVEITTVPYVHKAFLLANRSQKEEKEEKMEFEPFIAIPFGIGISGGTNPALSSVVLGSLFKSSEKLRFVLEFGIAINNTESYIAGGLIYYR